MSSTLDRLRRLHGARPQKTEEKSPVPTPEPERTQPALKPRRPAIETTLESLVPGEVIENDNGTCYVVTERYPLHELRGEQPLANLLNHHPKTFAPFHRNFGLQDTIDFSQALFIDTETTGLGNGAGVYCFMVGVGMFETGDGRRETGDRRRETRDGRHETGDGLESSITQSSNGDLHPQSDHPITQWRKTPAERTPDHSHFVVRQFFMRHPGEEGAMLMALVELLDSYGMSVTFNGRTFDLPLLRTRLRQNQHIYPELRGSGRLLEAEQPHLDLLHPARRIWKRRLQSCRLINLELEILGMQRSAADVPGYLIPQLYVDYLQSENASAMDGIFYHNREDIVSMVALAIQLSCAYSTNQNTPVHEWHGLDWLSLGRCYVEQQRWIEAERAFAAALERLAGNGAQADAFAELARLQKRQQRWNEAAETWQQWLSTVPGLDPTPYIELAKYCEWQCKDLEQAAMWTQWALHTLNSAPAWQRTERQIAELEHRLARIQRKQK